MKKINFKKALFLGLIALSIIGCQDRLEPQEFDNELGKDLPIEPSYADDTIRIESLTQLRKAAIRRGKVIIMTPGEYTAEGTMPDDPKTIFHFSGSDNKFIFDDVKIIIPTEVLRNMGPGNTHEFAAYRIDGSNIEIEGGTFENTGDERPYKSLSEFELFGNNITMTGCNFIIRGSEPYGYGDMYGKGTPTYVTLYKHAAMAIFGDNAVIDNCDFKVFAFGHGIHIHGSQNTTIRRVTMEGVRRLTDEILAETAETHPNSPAVSYGHRIWFPEEKRDLPIPADQMLSLTEDGIRLYLEGNDINGVNRRTGDILVEDCFVDKMRGGITLAIGSGICTVKNNVSINNEHAYSFPNSAIVSNNKGNTAYGPLLILPYDHKRDAKIELELVDSEETKGDHNFAEIFGSKHNITFTYEGTNPDANLRPIMVGVEPVYGSTANSDEVEPDATVDGYIARENTINNYTNNPLSLGIHSSDNIVNTNATVENIGLNNTVNPITD